MLHPLIRLAADRPEWLAEHLLAYSELFGNEFTRAAAQWRRHAAWQIAALVLGTLALGLAGVAALLWFALDGNVRQPLMLWLVPAVPALAMLLCSWVARPGAGAGIAFERLRLQLQADALALKEATR